MRKYKHICPLCDKTQANILLFLYIDAFSALFVCFFYSRERLPQMATPKSFFISSITKVDSSELSIGSCPNTSRTSC